MNGINTSMNSRGRALRMARNLRQLVRRLRHGGSGGSAGSPIEQLGGLLSPQSLVLDSAQPDYDERRRQFGYYLDTEDVARSRLRPGLLVVPATEEDVCETVRFAVSHGYRVMARSGGHSYRATSSLSGDRTIQIDMGRFTHLSFEAAARDNTRENHERGLTQRSYRVSVGAGVRLKELSLALNRYHCLIPAGMCMNVGVGGHFQSSALGLLAKAFGRGFEYATRVRIVVASGEVVTASRDENADLFWALRGGSPGAFGVVLEWEFDAINELDYTDVSYAMRRTWVYSDERAAEVLTRLFEMARSRDFSTTRNCTLTMIVASDKSEGHMLSGEGMPAMSTIIVILVWCGVDNGSIYGEIPEALRDPTTPPGTTFYEFYIESLKQIDGVIEEQSKEFSPAEDPDMTLGRIGISLSLATDNAGRAARVYSDYKLSMRLARQPDAWNERRARERAQKLGIDWEHEEIRYENSSRHTHDMNFDHSAFVDAFVSQHRHLQQNPCLSTMTQLSFNGLAEPAKPDFPCISTGLFRYDCWSLWRASAGQQTANIAKRWSRELDEAFCAVLYGGHGERIPAGTSHPAFPTRDLDLSDDRVRASYYADKAQYDRLTVVKRAVDPEDCFHTPFTVPSANDDVWARDGRNLRFAATTGMSRRDGRPTFDAWAGPNLLTLVGQMEHNALAQRDEPYIQWIDAKGRESMVTFGGFRDAVVRKASWLAHHTAIRKGDRIVLCVQPGPDYVVALMALLYLGAVPVPAYPVPLFQRPNWLTSTFDKIVREVAPRFILADKQISIYRLKASPVGPAVPAPGGRTPWVVAGADDRPVTAATLSLDDEAIIQYTSGTTGNAPKGAVLTHGNLLSQFLFIGDTYRDRGNVRGFAWVPPYHDLGLFMAIFTTIMFGFRLTAVSPVDFLKNPLLWFDYLSRYEITHTAGPNFAYSLCLDRLRELSPADLARWDLSHLVSLGSGGEPIDQTIMQELLGLLEQHCRLRPGAFTPCYGLAEVGCAVTIEGKQVLHADVHRLSRSPELHFVDEGAEHAIALVGCGSVEHGNVAIVDANGRRLPDNHLGEIWVSSPSLALQYVDRNTSGDLDRRLSSDARSSWLATGDMGFIHNDELFVMGRLSDRIHLGERSFFPHHIEGVANEAGDFRKGNTTAYADRSPSGVQTLHVAVELRTPAPGTERRIAEAVVARVRERFGINHDAVVHFMAPRSAVRTTSGKLVRHMTAAAIADGRIKARSFSIAARSR